MSRRQKTQDPDFHPWSSISRWNRNVVITEKIDGANACIVITEFPDGVVSTENVPSGTLTSVLLSDGKVYNLRAQSRNQFVEPGGLSGFGDWVYANAYGLAEALGVGYHFGEWWGNGIQRNYGLPQGDKRFSLFNTSRWENVYMLASGVPGLGVVPVLAKTTGDYLNVVVEDSLNTLRRYGSFAAPFMNPEGIVIYHTASNTMWKKTLDNDDTPKSAL